MLHATAFSASGFANFNIISTFRSSCHKLQQKAKAGPSTAYKSGFIGFTEALHSASPSEQKVIGAQNPI